MRKNIILLFLLVSQYLFSQNTFNTSFTFDFSFTVSNIVETNEGFCFTQEILTNTEQVPIGAGSWPHAAFTRINQEGEIISSYFYSNPDFLDIFGMSNILFQDSQNNFYFQTGFADQIPSISQGVLKVNEFGMPIWYKQLRILDGNKKLLYAENNSQTALIITFGHSQSLGKIELTFDGEILSNKEIEVLAEHLDQSNFQHNAFLQHSSNDYYAAGFTISPEDSRESIWSNWGYGFVHRLDNLGDTKEVWSTHRFLILSLNETSNGDLIFAGNYQEIVGNDTISIPAVVKTNQEGDVIWSKAMNLEEARYKISGANIDPDDNIVLISQVFGDKYSSIIKLNQEGEVLWAKAHAGWGASFEPKINITQDNGMLFSSTIESETGDLIGQIFKLDENGDIEGIPIKEMCFDEPSDFDLVFEKHPFEVDTVINLGEFLVVEANPYIHEMGEIAVPPFPLPDFVIPSIICADQCTLPTNLENEDAFTWDWYFEGAEVENFNVAEPGQICWNEPGTYLARQIIQFQNCLDTFETMITIVPDIVSVLDSSILFCPNEEPFIDGTSENTDFYSWSNGENTSAITPDTSGVYVLTAENSHCQTIDTISVNFFNEIYINPPLSLPQDTSICKQHFPLNIEANLIYSSTGIWEDNSTDNQRAILEEGSYSFTTLVDNCAFTESIRIEERKCDDLVYIPNAFSPNNDGINDYFQPLGMDFILINFSIYSRWGELIFETSKQNESWNGSYKGKILDNDVFAYVIVYQNPFTDEVITETGDVTVLK